MKEYCPVCGMPNKCEPYWPNERERHKKYFASPDGSTERAIAQKVVIDMALESITNAMKSYDEGELSRFELEQIRHRVEAIMTA